MAAFTCHRCGAGIEQTSDRLTVSVVIRWSPGDQELLWEYELCEVCAGETEDHLVLETTYHEPA
ncbi:MAG: hypothetical protein R3324_18620 [Halobacteriales archaeon]|nr:hypothetical protein [Halobacteriales archaeon]